MTSVEHDDYATREVLARECPAALLDTANGCVVVVDEQWRIVFANKAAAQEVGLSGPSVGLPFWIAFPGLLGTCFEHEYRRVMRDRAPANFEGFFPPSESWYEVQASPLSCGGMIAWFRNINEGKAAQRAIAEAEERYRILQRAANDLVWDWDLEKGEVKWNNAFGDSLCCQGLGYETHEFGTNIGWWTSRVHPDDLARVEASLSEAIEGESDVFACEYRFRREDGSYADIYDRGFVMCDSNGTAVRMVGTMQDNTERRRSEQAEREQRAQLATVFGQATVGIMHCAADGSVLMVNDRFREILARRQELHLGNLKDHVHPEDVSRTRKAFDERRTLGEPFQAELRFVRPDETSVWCDVSVSFVHGEDATTPSLIIVAQDISHRKAVEQSLAEQSELLQNVIDSVADLIFVKDLSGRFILANRALNEGCGALVGHRTSDFFEPDLVPTYEQVDQAVIGGAKTQIVEEVIPINGACRLFQTVKVPWVREGGIAGVIGVSRDITERKEAEAALRQSELLHRSVLEASADCICILDCDGRIQLMNSPGQRAFELDGAEGVLGRDLETLWPAAGRKLVRAALREARAGQIARFSGCCPTAWGTPKWWDVVVTPMCEEGGEVTRLLAISRDISAQRESADRLKWASEHDALTSLPNRRAFQARLQAAALRAMQSSGTVGLLLIDLDHFKHVNDTMGHAAGDHLLKSFAQRLRAGVRDSDFVARLGGDEFAVILEGSHDEDDLVATGASILSRLKDPIRYDGRVMSAGASIGGAVFPRHAQTANELFNNADTALYALKEAGRGGTKMFHQHMRERAQKVASQLNLARVAMSEGSVEPHYQPKVELETGRVVGFEALLRWRHPSRGLQLPDTVLEAFKDYELAAKIGELMQRRVFADVASWLKDGVDAGVVAINAAPAEFLRDDFAERLLARLHEYAIPPAVIEVEVTEHVFFDRASDYVSRALSVLKDAGIRIALDDFGTGYSSLSHLRDFPVDVVKIDQSFVAKMVSDAEIRAIVAAVVSLAKSLHIDVVAEGVELDDHRTLLALNGCTYAQGHLFGKAVSADDVRRSLQLGDRASILLTSAA